MGHSYSQNLIHCVYSTDERRNLIAPELQEQLWAFKGVIAKREGVPLLVAGGMENHAHLLIALPPTIALAKALQAIKAYSSRWMSEHRVDFKWQEAMGRLALVRRRWKRLLSYDPTLACWAKVSRRPSRPLQPSFQLFTASRSSNRCGNRRLVPDLAGPTRPWLSKSPACRRRRRKCPRKCRPRGLVLAP